MRIDITSFWRRSRAWVTSLCLAGLLLACPFNQEDTPEEEPIPPRPLDTAETVYFSFPADGMWHVSPYLALHDDVLNIQAHPNTTRFVPNLGLNFTIGRQSHIIGEQNFRVGEPGPMSFKVSPQYVNDYTTSLTVVIERLER